MATTELSGLARTLGLGAHELVTVVGGGGKTTFLMVLGHQLQGRRIMTTTTKMGRDRTGGFPVLFGPTQAELDTVLESEGGVVVWRADSGRKVLGVSPERCDEWLNLADYVLVEADGAAGYPFKAPRPLEPVVPRRTTTMLACIGADALGRVIADQCHRPLRVAAVADCSPYERLTPERAARVLLDPRGSRKGCPESARFVVVVNRVDTKAAGLVAELEEAVGSGAELIQVGFDLQAGAREAGSRFA